MPDHIWSQVRIVSRTRPIVWFCSRSGITQHTEKQGFMIYAWRMINMERPKYIRQWKYVEGFYQTQINILFPFQFNTSKNSWFHVLRHNMQWCKSNGSILFYPFRYNIEEETMAAIHRTRCQSDVLVCWLLCFNSNLTEFCFHGPNQYQHIVDSDNDWIGYKALSEAIMTLLSDAYTRHLASMS